MGDEQSQFMYMFERLSEPLYFGPRGNKNAYFNIDLSSMANESTKAKADWIREQLTQSGIISSQSFNIKVPTVNPDLQDLHRACKKNEAFSFFLSSHNQAANDLIAILMAQPSREEFINMCAHTRDSPMVNSQLWVHAVSSAALQRADMRGFRVPGIWEVLPEMFIPTEVIEMARGEAALPTVMRSVLKVHRFWPTWTALNENFFATWKDLENRLWYFREDLALASHHWHWHLLYPHSYKGPKMLRDRKGELFYYMHRNLLNRYNAERICNGLPFTVELDLSDAPVLEEGYFPKLTVANSGRNWPGRQDHTKVYGMFRSEEPHTTSEDILKWKDRLLNAIHAGYICTADGSTVELTLSKGIDILAGLVENGGFASLNPEYYGNIHNIGHSIIASCHDPYDKYNEGMGVMTTPITSTKDPAFYRWHTFVENIFESYKTTLPPYRDDELLWPGVQILKVGVTQGNEGKNILATSWMDSDIDLTRGLDLRRSPALKQGPVWARVTHLTHECFKYNISVKNQSDQTLPATLRIFMAPRFDANKCRIPFTKQRTLFFEMDKVSIELVPGVNEIVRLSTDSAVTVPWEQSFQDLEEYIDMGQLDTDDIYCGCGWPQHLLLPKGTREGVVFDLFVMLTDGTKDAVPKVGENCPKCKFSVAFCGILDEPYPDAKPMGFPFDRIGKSTYSSGNGSGLMDCLEEFIPQNSNIAAIQIMIVNRNTVCLRGNGAPPSMHVKNVFEEQDIGSENETSSTLGSWVDCDGSEASSE
ncbi:unnamed protein product [Allacma fusca]|uniref:Uncharacterized protein n=1 Tax=Allacma fusca TaxID=39272 RepID=A0A8J2PCP6_9HEXA|nr:unnamed protein product [Allacma fusca]